MAYFHLAIVSKAISEEDKAEEALDLQLPLRT